jgi:hypothetical protein
MSNSVVDPVAARSELRKMFEHLALTGFFSVLRCFSVRDLLRYGALAILVHLRHISAALSIIASARPHDDRQEKQQGGNEEYEDGGHRDLDIFSVKMRDDGGDDRGDYAARRQLQPREPALLKRELSRLGGEFAGFLGQLLSFRAIAVDPRNLGAQVKGGSIGGVSHDQPILLAFDQLATDFLGHFAVFPGQEGE